MASGTAQTHNGILNGEEPSSSPSSLGQEPGSPQPHVADPDEKDTQEPTQGTTNENPAAPEEEEEEEDPLPDYEYYEQLELLARNGADSAAFEAQDGSTTGTPHDNNEDPTDTAVKHDEPRDTLESDKSQDDEASPDGSSPDTGRTGQGSSLHREPEEASEGTELTTPLQMEETNVELSDNKKGPVRQQLKKTSIAEAAQSQSLGPEDRDMASSQESSSEKAEQASENSSVEGRGRERKRSFDDIEGDDTAETAESKMDKEEDGHRRKRSRDSKEDDEIHDRKSDNSQTEDPQEDVANDPGTETPLEESASRTPPDDPLDKIRSPTKKRSRDRFDADNLVAANKNDTAGDTAPKKAEGEPEKKRHRDNSQEGKTESTENVDSAKPSLPQPFANTSSASPFTSLPASKPDTESKKDEAQKDQSKTSSSAFASSKLSAFAGSDKSPFGAMGSADSVFKSSPAPSAATKEGGSLSSAFAKSAFGAAAASPSAFGSIGSGFGGSGSDFSSGFGLSAAKSGGGLTSFAAPGGSSVLGSGSKSKNFGATSDDEDDEENEEEEGTIGLEGTEKEEQDERFYAQETETGEEGEEKYFSCRAKLFFFDKKEWRERGTGTFKLNVTKKKAEKAQLDDGGESGEVKKVGRMIMRTDRVLRVVLNAPLFKGMKLGSPTGEEPTDKLVNLVVVEDGKTVPLLLRTANVEVAKDLYHTTQDLLQQL